MTVKTVNKENAVELSLDDMTDVLGKLELQEVADETTYEKTDAEGMEEFSETGDIPLSQITIGNGTMADLGNFETTESYPQILPTNPIFKVPSNPLLPEEYSEYLDYNSLQYLNGFFRTQIGKYVKVQQLIGSDITEDFEGFLIGVGINYIILQEYSNKNIRILDIYGVKQMYVYYTEPPVPYL